MLEIWGCECVCVCVCVCVLGSGMDSLDGMNNLTWWPEYKRRDNYCVFVLRFKGKCVGCSLFGV